MLGGCGICRNVSGRFMSRNTCCLQLEKCGHCEFTSPYKQVVLHHSMRHHGVDLNNVPVERTLKCDLCDFAAFTKQVRPLPWVSVACIFLTKDRLKLVKFNTSDG